VTSVSNFISKHIQQGQQKAAKKLTAQLRRKAYQSGWPSGASRHLTVVPSDLSYKVTYPAKHAQTVEDAEYGTEHSQPNPVVRNFLTGVKDTEMTAYFDRVLKKGGLF
jgi:hypothetical protein